MGKQTRERNEIEKLLSQNFNSNVYKFPLKWLRKVRNETKKIKNKQVKTKIPKLAVKGRT